MAVLSSQLKQQIRSKFMHYFKLHRDEKRRRCLFGAKYMVEQMREPGDEGHDQEERKQDTE
jgi:hypothetical protein